MIDMLKKMAIQKLVTKMGANSLSAEADSGFDIGAIASLLGGGGGGLGGMLGKVKDLL